MTDAYNHMTVLRGMLASILEMIEVYSTLTIITHDEKTMHEIMIMNGTCCEIISSFIVLYKTYIPKYTDESAHQELLSSIVQLDNLNTTMKSYHDDYIANFKLTQISLN